MEFPKEFTDMVDLLFQGEKARISVNVRVTKAFTIGQEVCRGCPLAPNLFPVVGGILNACIKREVA